MNAAENYLRDVLPLLFDRARKLRTEQLAAEERGDSEAARFEAGRVTGYYQVLSTLVNQLEVFGLRPDTVGLPSTLDLEKELL